MKVSELLSLHGNILTNPSTLWDIGNSLKTEIGKVIDGRFDINSSDGRTPKWALKITDWRGKTRKWHISITNKMATLSYNDREIKSSEELDDIGNALQDHFQKLLDEIDKKVTKKAENEGNVAPFIIKIVKEVMDSNGIDFHQSTRSMLTPTVDAIGNEAFTIANHQYQDGPVNVGAQFSGSTIKHRISTDVGEINFAINMADPSFSPEWYANWLLQCIRNTESLHAEAKAKLGRIWTK